MTMYQGGKHRIANEILTIILKNRDCNQVYVEPFIGGANVFYRVANPKIGADINEAMAKMWQEVERGWLPPTSISEDEYKSILEEYLRNDHKVSALDGFALSCCSYGGKFADSYAKSGKDGRIRNYAAGGWRALVRQESGIRGSEIFHRDYRELNYPDRSLIYCDPPYLSCSGYSGIKFNHEEFYKWCISMRKNGHEIYISERYMPEPFVEIWRKDVICSMELGKTTKVVEKLFTILL